MQHDETDLIRRIVLYDDHRAFGSLVDHYQEEVRNLFFKMTNCDRTLTDDLSQEVFIRVYKHIKRFREQSKFSTWLYRIAVNVLYDHRKQLKQPQEITTDVSTNETETLQNKIDINNALKILNVRERTAIILHYEKGFPHSEITKIMKLPLGTVKTHILRGKEKLKEYFKYEQ